MSNNIYSEFSEQSRKSKCPLIWRRKTHFENSQPIARKLRISQKSGLIRSQIINRPAILQRWGLEPWIDHTRASDKCWQTLSTFIWSAFWMLDILLFIRHEKERKTHQDFLYLGWHLNTSPNKHFIINRL